MFRLFVRSVVASRPIRLFSQLRELFSQLREQHPHADRADEHEREDDDSPDQPVNPLFAVRNVVWVREGESAEYEPAETDRDVSAASHVEPGLDYAFDAVSPM